MNKIVSLLSCFIVLCTFPMACKKQEIQNNNTVVERSSHAYPSTTSHSTDYEDCSVKTVTLCSQRTGVAGSLVIAAGPYGKTDFTFSTTSTWKIEEIQLYVGSANGIPRSRSGDLAAELFPNQNDFNQSPVTSYTFPLTDIPLTYYVSAKLTIVRPAEKGKGIETATVWADGCNGNAVGNSRPTNNGNHFRVDMSDCEILAAFYEQVTTCSRSVNSVMALDETYLIQVPWTYDQITIAGKTYTESEARAIASASGQSVSADTRYAFMVVGTLKQSNTGISSSAYLPQNVAIIESFLASRNKLSPQNLPPSSDQVKYATLVVNSWIQGHICNSRR